MTNTEAAAGPDLRGKVIVVTRAVGQSRPLTEELRQRGATVLEFPLVEFLPPRDESPFERAAANLSRYDWVVFTSQNAVRFFFDAGARRERQPSWAGRPAVAAVGSETERSLAARGVRVDLCPEKSSAAALLESLRPQVAGKKILLPQSNRANPTLAEQLRQSGAEVDAVVAYRTAAPATPDPELLGRIRHGAVDAIAFASPSAVQNFLELVGRSWLEAMAHRIGWASIGPTTSAALRTLGLPVVEAERATSTGLARALAEFFTRERPILETRSAKR